MKRSRVGVAVIGALLCSTVHGYADVPAGGFKSPEGDPRFKAGPGLKPLNNLVFELLNLRAPGQIDHIFRNPREGWVYVRVQPSGAGGSKSPVAVLDDVEIPLKQVGDGFEAMRYLCEGPHTIGTAQSAADRLEVRAIGALVYAAYGDDPHIPETGKYTWDYLRKYCLDNYNSMIGSSKVGADGKSPQEAEIKEWTGQGKRWYTIEPVPDDVRVPRAAKTADEAFDYWTKTTGMTHPLMSGIFGDEFGGKHQTKYYAGWSEALRRIKADPKFSNREFHPYTTSQFWPYNTAVTETYPFFRSLLELGSGLATEWYQVEGRSRPGRIITRNEDLLTEIGPEWERASRESFERLAPGAASERIVVLSVLAEPGQETSDLFANYNYNAFLEAQFRFIATDPSFFGIRGLQQYLSSYCGEEQLRLFSKLVRHYAIEGKTDPLLKDPYVLTHLQNPDFIDGTAGWTLAPATPGSVSAKTVPGLGTLEAKYHAPPGTGDAAVLTKRSMAKPNTISQEIRGLTPGRLYSLRFYTGDYQEFLQGKSEKRNHPTSIRIENTESIPAKSFQAHMNTGYWYPFGKFNRDNPYWMNYHQQVFRAKGTTARLTLSDWASPTGAGGPDGQELLWNFIQVQPYFE